MKSYRLYLSLIVFFFAVFCVPETFSQRMRWFAAAIPLSRQAKAKLSLDTENARLRQEISKLLSWIDFEEEIGVQIQRAQKLFQLEGPFFERRGQYLAQIIDRKLRGVPARVVFREPVSWSCRVWLNIGEEANASIGSRVVAVGSPVLCQGAAIGVIEQVNSSRSLVRLITDPMLSISVRCVRGGEQDQTLARACKSLAKDLKLREELEGGAALASALTAFVEMLGESEEAYFLAKGVLHGAGQALWRSLGQSLKGEGFNYDFADEEGPARDLRTGLAPGRDAIPLICVGDLLVTTGLDGVFPPDLPVATVTKIHPLNEGECSYDLEAKATKNLSYLRDVIVLPPL